MSTTTIETGLNDTSSKARSDSKPPKGTWKPRVIMGGLIVLCLAGIFLSPNALIAGGLVIALMIVLLFTGMPVAFALALPSIVGIYAISGVQATINVLAVAPYNAVSSWSLSVLPMFIFMGMLLMSSGMTGKMYQATGRWFSWLPGGLGIGTTAAGAGLSSVSGSTIGMTYALGQAGIPEMLRAGYDRRVAVGTVIIAGLPGNLIPPSILLVVYAGIANVPVGPQLIAGALPGILIALTFAIFLFILGSVAPQLFGRSKKGHKAIAPVTWAERFQSLRDIWAFPVIMFVLFAGMFSGVFTPTEAGAAAALVSLLLCLWYRRNDAPLKAIAQAAVSSVAATAAIFFLLVGAEMLTRILAVTGLAQATTDFITGLGLSRFVFLVALIVLYLIMGMFFDTLSMMLLTIPILLPTFAVMDINVLWFGVFVVLLGELGMITPPVGVLSYIVHNIAQKPEVNLGQQISLKDVFVSLLWFLPIAVFFLFLMIWFPEMATWLPGMMESS